MLSVLLLILKIIGIILLTLLGIVVLLLIVPICYKVNVNLHNKDFKVKVNVNWLKFVLRFALEYSDDVRFHLRIFGIKVFKSPKLERSSKLECSSKLERSSEHKDELNTADNKTDDNLEGISMDDINNAASKEESNNQLDSSYIEDAKNNQADEANEIETLTKEEKKAQKARLKAEKKAEKEENKARKKEEKQIRKEEKAKNKEEKESLKEKIDNNKYVKIYKDDSFKPALRQAWKILKKALRHVLPRRMKGEVIFGISNPALLGEMFGFLALFFGPSGRWLNKLSIVPDFCEERVDVDANIYGHVTPVVLLVYFLRIIINRDVRRVITLSKEKEK